MKTHIARHSRRGGFTYVSVVLTATVVGLLLATYLQLVASQNQMTLRSQAWNRTVPVLEAGIEEALAHLNKNAAAVGGVFTLNLESDGWVAAAGGGWTKTNTIGDDYYEVTIGAFTAGSVYPKIVSNGFVKQQPTFSMLPSQSYTPFLAQVPALQIDRSASYTKRTVECLTTNVPMFTHGLIAKDKVELNGKNVMSDSFDSTIPGVNCDFDRHYDPAKRLNNGDIASNGTIEDAIDIGNARIFGHVYTGPKGGIEIGPGGGIGTFAWVPANPGTIQPGWWRNDLNVEFPEETLPYTTGLGPERDRVKDGITYKMVFGTGDYWLSSTTGDYMTGKILVDGHARIVVNGKIQLIGLDDRFVVASNASVRLWMNGDTAVFGGLGIINPTGVASNFYYFGTQKNVGLVIGGNSALTMAIYAPNAFLQLNGGGTSTTNDFQGAAVVRAAKFNGNFNFHFDEALPKTGLYRGYTLTSWNEK
jgi:hypothetical protein